MGKPKQTYQQALYNDRALYLRQRNNLARLGFDLIERIGTPDQESAIEAFRKYATGIGIERD